LGIRVIRIDCNAQFSTFFGRTIEQLLFLIFFADGLDLCEKFFTFWASSWLFSSWLLHDWMVLLQHYCSERDGPFFADRGVEFFTQGNYEMKMDFVTSPESTTSVVDNRIIWVLALTPIVGILVELLGLVMIGLPIPILPEIVVIVLGIPLAYADQKKLKAIGHDTSQMGQPWLVPIYLFKRAKILNHKAKYLTVWCGLCILMILL